MSKKRPIGEILGAFLQRHFDLASTYENVPPGAKQVVISMAICMNGAA
jgi:hypothetical protein